MSTNTPLQFKLVSTSDLNNIVSLDKKKLLVGSSDQCDIVLDSNHVSHYHAYIFISAHGCKIIDLDSLNGTFINGSQGKEHFFSVGDCLRVADCEFMVQEESLACELIDQDAQSIIKLINTPPREILEKPTSENMILVDDEYCDIVFEDNYKHVTDLSFLDTQITREYIDTFDDSKNEIIEDITLENASGSIEYALYANAQCLDVQYLSLEESQYGLTGTKAGKNELTVPFLDDESAPFISIENGAIYLQGSDIYDIYDIADKDKKLSGKVKLNGEQTLIVVVKDIQITLRMSNLPPRLKSTPFFQKDKQFLKEFAKIATPLITLMLLLLLVDVHEEKKKEEKQIAVIYRIPQDAPKPTKTGRVVEKVSQKVVKAKKAAPKKSTPKKVAKAEVKPQKPKSLLKKNSLTGLLDSLKTSEVVAEQTTGAVEVDTSSAVAAVDTSQLTETGIEATSSFGNDITSDLGVSSGTRGLASKNGFENAYMEPKTVVLGSMDPELLRKILREYLPQFRHCYQKELEDNSEKIKGVIDLNFKINKIGRAAGIDIQSKRSKFSKNGVDCMGQVLSLIEFPKPKGGGIVEVRQPLNFFSEKKKI